MKAIFAGVGGHGLWEADVTPAPITDETEKIVTANAGHTWRDLDGTTVLAADRPALAPRSSPYGALVKGRNLRAIYASVGGVRRLVLIDPATVTEPVSGDCTDLVAAEHERTRKAAIAAVEAIA